jgi:predicted porin
MKKSLIALAALSAFATAAQAQSSVTVYGILDIGYGDSKMTNTSTTAANNVTRKSSTTGNGDGGLSTSRIGFRGVEDLGSGNKAKFMLEYDLIDSGTQASTTHQPGTSTASTFGARESWVALENNKLGELKLGRQATAIHGIVAGFSTGYPNNSVGAVYSAGMGVATTAAVPNEGTIRPHQVYVNRAIGYTSPNMNGFVASVQYGKNKTDDSRTTDVNAKPEQSETGASLRYTQGKLDVGYGYQEIKNQGIFAVGTAQTAAGAAGTASGVNSFFGNGWDTTAGGGYTGELKQKTQALGASYNFGMVQPFVMYSERTGSASSTVQATSGDLFKQKATEIGARVPVGAKVVAFASMYDGNVKFNNQGQAVGSLQGKDDLSGYQLGLTYALSKRTTAYAITGKQEFKGASLNNTDKMKVTGTVAGVRHSF